MREDGRDAFMPLLCCRYPVGGSLRELDEREGLTYLARQRLRVHLPDCGSDLVEGFLSAHRQNQHINGLSAQWKTPPCEGASDILGVLYESDVTAGVPSKGLTGKGGDMDRAMREICVLIYEENCDNNGGGRPTLPTVSSM